MWSVVFYGAICVFCCQMWSVISVVCHLCGLSSFMVCQSMWPVICVLYFFFLSMWSVIYVVCHMCLLLSMWSAIYVVCHLCFVISVVCHQCGLSSVSSVISVVCHLCGLSSVCFVINVVCHQCGLSYVSSVINVVCHLCGLSTRVPLHQNERLFVSPGFCCYEQTVLWQLADVAACLAVYIRCSCKFIHGDNSTNCQPSWPSSKALGW